jgi:sugar lactone lactonase YvrE
MDTEGYLWNCRYGGTCIVRLSPAGHLQEIFEMPVPNITNCTFGGPARCTLYVTTAASSERLSGSLFAFETDVTGTTDHRFEIRRTADIPV